MNTLVHKCIIMNDVKINPVLIYGVAIQIVYTSVSHSMLGFDPNAWQDRPPFGRDRIHHPPRWKIVVSVTVEELCDVFRGVLVEVVQLGWMKI